MSIADLERMATPVVADSSFANNPARVAERIHALAEEQREKQRRGIDAAWISVALDSHWRSDAEKLEIVAAIMRLPQATSAWVAREPVTTANGGTEFLPYAHAQFSDICVCDDPVSVGNDCHGYPLRNVFGHKAMRCSGRITCKCECVLCVRACGAKREYQRQRDAEFARAERDRLDRYGSLDGPPLRELSWEERLYGPGHPDLARLIRNLD